MGNKKIRKLKLEQNNSSNIFLGLLILIIMIIIVFLIVGSCINNKSTQEPYKITESDFTRCKSANCGNCLAKDEKTCLSKLNGVCPGCTVDCSTIPDPSKCNYDPKSTEKCDKGTQIPATNAFLESLDETNMVSIFGLNPPSNCITAKCDAKDTTCNNLYTWKNFKIAVEIWNHVFGTDPDYPKYFNYSKTNDNKLLLAAIMANCKHESAHFTACKERLKSKGYSQCPNQKVNQTTCLCDLDKSASGRCPPEGKQNCSSGFTANTETDMTYCCDKTGCTWGGNNDKSCYLSAWNNMSPYRKQLFINKNRGDCNANCIESELNKSGELIQKCVVCKDIWGETLNNAHCYFGRGPTQLTWSVNYKKASDILDKIPDYIWCRYNIEYIGLLLDPDSLCTYGIVAWLTALAYFTTNSSCIITDGENNKNITCNITQLLACVGAAAGNSESVGYFSEFVVKLGATNVPGNNPKCDYIKCCESKGKDCDDCITNLPICWGKNIPYIPPTCTPAGSWCDQQIAKTCCGNGKCIPHPGSTLSGTCDSSSVVPPNACDNLGCPKNQTYMDKWWCKDYPGKSSGSGSSNLCNGQTPGRANCKDKSKSDCQNGCVWGNFGWACGCYSCDAPKLKKCK
jgi:hypothetical protein